MMKSRNSILVIAIIFMITLTIFLVPTKSYAANPDIMDQVDDALDQVQDALDKGQGTDSTTRRN